MDTIYELINITNFYLWSYVLVAMLVGCAIWFSFKTRLMQFSMMREMFSLLGERRPKDKRQISSFEAFAISLACRVGTGNLAGVAAAITLGGPGAVFWMWVIAIIGSVNAFVESTLAQAYKVQGKDSYVGGPAYYISAGLGKRWLGVVFAFMISVSFGFALASVQSNTICAAMSHTFGTSDIVIGVLLTAATLFAIFGGVHRIAKISSVVVPVMALGYIFLALFIVLSNFSELPRVINLIISSAFGFEQALGGTVGAALMQGVKRGLFSNEAGMGTSPNAAATADVSHPVKQGLIQTLGVFVDTLFVCSCTAFIILFSGLHLDSSVDGINLTQQALTAEIGHAGGAYIAIAVLLFAFSSILANYYYGESNIQFITKNKRVLFVYRIATAAMVMLGSVMSLELAWNLVDVTMALLTILNLVAILLLGGEAKALLDDYRNQRAAGVKSPVFSRKNIPSMASKISLWP